VHVCRFCNGHMLGIFISLLSIAQPKVEREVLDHPPITQPHRGNMPLLTIISEPCSFKLIGDGEGYRDIQSAVSARDTRLGFIILSIWKRSYVSQGRREGLPQGLCDMRSDDM
jgi:hypothetical protein